MFSLQLASALIHMFLLESNSGRKRTRDDDEDDDERERPTRKVAMRRTSSSGMRCSLILCRTATDSYFPDDEEIRQKNFELTITICFDGSSDIRASVNLKRPRDDDDEEEEERPTKVIRRHSETPSTDSGKRSSVLLVCDDVADYCRL